jgi:ABC-type transport system substrate-binding protein
MPVPVLTPLQRRFPRRRRSPLLVVGAFCLVAACADRTSPPASRIVRIGATDLIRTLNPLRTSATAETDAVNIMFDGLVALDTTGSLVGALADRWEWLENGRRIRFHLRAGTRFHDGTPLTGKIVAQSLHVTAMDAAVGSVDRALSLMIDVPPPEQRTRGDVERAIVAPDDSTVDISVRGRNAGSVAMFAEPVWKVRPPGADSTSTIGTGSWKLARGSAGDSSMVFVGWGQPWRPAPAIDSLEVQYLGGAAMLDALSDGRLDCVPLAPLRLRRLAALRPDMRISESAPAMLVLVILSPKWKLGADVRVRRALLMLIDREEMPKAMGIRRSVVAPGVEHAFATGADRIEPWPFNPSTARALLDSAGLSARDTLRLAYFSPIPADSQISIAAAIGRTLRAAGLTVRFVGDQDRMVSIARGDVDLGVTSMTPFENQLGSNVRTLIPTSRHELLRELGSRVRGMDSLTRVLETADAGAPHRRAMRAVDEAIRTDLPILPLWFFGTAAVSRTGGSGCDERSVKRAYRDVVPGPVQPAVR